MTGTVAITGAASGIGQAAARRLLGQGWTVFGLDAARDRLDATAAQFAAFQDRFKPIVCDVTDATRVAAAFAEINFITPTLDALICCAGILRTAPLESMRVEEFDQVFAVNTRGTFLCAQGSAAAAAQGRDAGPARAHRAAVIRRGAAAEDFRRRLCRVEGGGSASCAA